MVEPLIVGVDPGNTSGVAAINLDGDLRLLDSKRELPPREIIQMIIDKGKPVVIACDKENMPSTVDKIASSLGARKFEPDQDLDKQWKKSKGKGENSHEKDAYASALNAYRNLQREIKKIDNYTEKYDEDRAVVADLYFSENLEKLENPIR